MHLEFAAEPNSRVCPVCMGMPGVLPVMNRQAYEYSVLTALALNCQIANFTKWDRKSYYYPDLPKNYQISQYDLPMSSNGFIEIPLEGGRTKRIGIIRAHLEEDAGKNLHSGTVSQVDLESRRHAASGNRYRSRYEQSAGSPGAGRRTAKNSPLSRRLRGRHAERPHAV